MRVYTVCIKFDLSIEICSMYSVALLTYISYIFKIVCKLVCKAFMHLQSSIVCTIISLGEIPRTTAWTSGNHKEYKIKQVEETQYVIQGNS